jgi:hypothetical protein
LVGLLLVGWLAVWLVGWLLAWLVDGLSVGLAFVWPVYCLVGSIFNIPDY